jgi:PAS domain S-box-containing protein
VAGAQVGGTTAALTVNPELELGQQAGIVTVAHAVVSGDGESGSTAALPGVLVDVPVAVLVIDQKAGTVIYANTAAVELAGNVGLPIAIDTWGAAAGLTDLGGAPLASTSSPLSLVAQGRPVAGEAVRLAPGKSTVSERAADRELENQLLWVTGFPLSRSTSSEQLALVVFLHLEGVGTDDPDAYLQALRERAVVATDITFTITDPREADDPLVWVNPSFSRMTGYSYDEAVGRNCRFLQGPATDPEAVAEIRAAIQEQRTVTTTLINYRKDGTAFWNQLSISPVFDGDGALVSFVGVQTDVTERVRVAGEREAAFAAEQAARREAEQARAIAEQAQSRLALMAEATSSLMATLDMDELLGSLAALCVPLLADWVYIVLIDPDGEVGRSASLHRDGRTAELDELLALQTASLPAGSPARRSLTTSRPVLVDDLTEERLAELLVSPAAVDLFRGLGGTSLLTVPLVARSRSLGAMGLVMSSGSRAFTPEDVDLAEDLARRAAMALDNVRLYQQEHTVADTLQRSLLPDLPQIPGIEAAAHYVSASIAADVGGDFYDLLALPDGSIGMVIGDVVGHDVAAAAAMGHLRGLIRACVWDADDPDPGVVLGRVDRLVQGLQVASTATMVYVRATPPVDEGRPWRLQVANAGHPPLLLRRPDGTVDCLDGVAGLLVGVDDSIHRQTLVVDIPAGSTVVAYTDGLIERPGGDLDQGISQLEARLAAAPVDAGPQQLCDVAVSCPLDRRDDVALIAVRFG